MKNKSKLLLLTLLVITAISALLLSGCGKKETTTDGTISEDTKFGAATLSLSEADLSAAGFTLGDSCDITFENGLTLTDVPYFNGYYVKNGAPVIVAYPGSSFVTITYNNKGIWSTEGFTDGDKVTLSLNTSGKYAAIQEALGQIYSFERKDYESDAEFCNFRPLSGGSLKENFLYRGASPVDNSRGRAAYTNALLEETGIHFVIDLADSEEDMETYEASDGFASDYTLALYENGSMALLDMGSAYQSEDYQKRLVSGLREMLSGEGPVYIHCMEGKDRTGFVCMLLEALAGAGYDEMASDYMTTYFNYYKVSREETPEKYEAIQTLYFDAFVSYLHGTEDLTVLKAADYTEDAAAYLRSGGMNDTEIAELISFLTK